MQTSAPPEAHTPSEQKRLLSIMMDPKRPPGERAEAGRQINQYGDPRPGIVDSFSFKSENYWCEVPAGEFTMGSNNSAYGGYPERKVTLPTFSIAKYPITYWQYQQFVDDTKSGFNNAQWWEGLHSDGLTQQQSGPGDQRFKFNNHPRENVSWYDAMAYCRWLSAQLPGNVTLPTEEQWEKAARGIDGREYPWGNGYREGYANIDEKFGMGGPNSLETTTAVGIYPQGESPYHVLDLSGNVMEWTLSAIDSRENDNLSSNARRVLRGGAWSQPADYVRAMFRHDSDPNLRYPQSGSGFVWFGCPPSRADR